MGTIYFLIIVGVDVAVYKIKVLIVVMKMQQCVPLAPF
jgi:hypothetical protein